MSSWGQDLRFSLRTLVRAPGFTLAALLTLALGIGATATMFTFLNGMLLKPLPYPEGDRLVAIEHVSSRGGVARANYLNYLDWAARSTSFESMAAYYETSFNLSTIAEPVRAQGIVATGELFRALEVEPLMGRGLSPADDRVDAPRAVVLSERVWERSFERDPDIIGTDVRLHGRPYTVVGVMPSPFSFPETGDIWVAARIDPATMDRANQYWRVVGRLAEGVSRATARAEMATVGAAVAAEHPLEHGGSSAGVTSLRDKVLGENKATALLFMGVVICVQLIATVNVSNLLLARATGRRQEVAVRAALGAGRGRIVRWLMTESLVLAVAGGAAGVALGVRGRDLIISVVPEEVPRWFDFSVDYRVLLFLVALTALNGVVFGLLPAMHATRDLHAAIQSGGQRAPSGRLRLRSGLVVAEVALALMLLIGAGLMMKGLANFQRIDPGLQTAGVLTARLSLPAATYEGASERGAFYRDVLERGERIAGVESVGAVAHLPYSNSGSVTLVSPEGFELEDENARPPQVIDNIASAGYFETIGIPLLQGRAFNPTDGAEAAERTVIINRLAAERFWPDESPVGKRLKFGFPDDESPWLTVVGVVDNVRHWNMRNPAWPTVYTPLGQRWPTTAHLVLRGAQSPLALVGPVRDAVDAVDSDLPLYDVSPMASVIRASSWQPSVFSAMFGVFAALALGLSSIGLYGVVSFSVGRRTREMGIRRALGALSVDVTRLVVGDAMRLVGIGVAVGLVGAVAVMGLLQSLLNGVSAYDASTYAAVTLTLAGVAFLAAWVPGRRAARVQPVVALKTD